MTDKQSKSDGGDGTTNTGGDTLKFRLTLALLEDLHSGTGTGSAEVDAVQYANRQGQPVIRASHLKGVWRQAAEEIVEVVTKGAPCPEGIEDLAELKNTLQDLFGSRGAQRRSALILESLRPVFPAHNQVWTSSARRPFSRLPLPDSLRSQEYVGAGTLFSGRLLIRARNGAQTPKLEALLRACLRRADAYGHRRQHGAGRVLASLDPATDWQPSKITHLEEPGESKRLRLLLRAVDPLCLPITGAPGNIIRSAGYIRGQTLAGALIAWALDKGDTVLAKELLAGETRISDALPLPDGQNPPSTPEELAAWDVLPIPLNIQTRKPLGTDLRWPWWASQGFSDFLRGDKEFDGFYPQDSDGEKPKRPGEWEHLFRTSPKSAWHRYSPPIGAHMRNGVKAADLYTEEEMGDRLLFLAEIEVPTPARGESMVKKLNPLFTGLDWLTLGRGGHPVEIVDGCWMPARPQPQRDRDSIGNYGFTLTLESDLIARDPWLGFHNRLDPKMLVELAGLNLQWDPETPWQSFCDADEVRGFNSSSGLPSVPRLAIRRGSCIRLEGSDHSIDLYRALLRQPALGEGQELGFGRFRLDFDPFNAPPAGPNKPPQPAESRREGVLEASHEQAETIKEKYLDKSQEKPPSRSQWGDFRAQVQAAATRQDLERLIDATIDHAKTTRGGQPWTRVDLDTIKTAIKKYEDLSDQRLYLDSLVRWLWPSLPGERH